MELKKKSFRGTLNSKLPKFKLSRFIFPMIVLIAVLGVIFNLSELGEIGKLFSQAKWGFLVLAAGAQFLTIASLGKTYHSIFRLLRLPKIKFFTVMKLSVTSLFLNFTIPAGGAAGDIWLFKKFRDHGANEGRALLSIFVEIVCYYVAFFALLTIAIIYAFIYFGHLGEEYKYFILGFALLVVVLGFFVYRVFSDKEKAQRKLMWLINKVDRDGKKGVSQHRRVKDLLEDYYRCLRRLLRNKKGLIVPILFQFGKFVGDALTIFFIFLAFGEMATFMLCLVAFAFGRFLGVLSFMPGGVGAFEGGMVLVLQTIFSLELSIAVMLVFRAFSYWVYIPLGIMFSKAWKVKRKKGRVWKNKLKI